jgi:hypothetical protein
MFLELSRDKIMIVLTLSRQGQDHDLIAHLAVLHL